VAVETDMEHIILEALQDLVERDHNLLKLGHQREIIFGNLCFAALEVDLLVQYNSHLLNVYRYPGTRIS